MQSKRLNPLCRFLILLLFTHLTVSYTSATELRFEQISVRDGLSWPAVWTICQDSYGFMWFGTHKGFNKYDGYEFTTYYLDDYTEPGGNDIYSLFEDSDSTLWIGTNASGLFKYNRHTDTFEHYINDPADLKSLGNNIIRSIFEDSHGNFWVGSENGYLHQMNRKTGQFTRIQFEDPRREAVSPIHNFVNAICEDSSGNLWIGTNQSGLIKMDSATGELIHYLHDTDDESSLSENSVWSLCVDKNNVLWIGTKQGGLNRFEANTNTFSRFFNNQTKSGDFDQVGILGILQDQSGILWLGTEYNGLIRFDPVTGRYRQYKVDQADPYSITDNSIWSLYEDNTGVIWIGTFSSGILKFDRICKGFLHYQCEPGYINSISSNTVWAICEDTLGDLWIGTFDGLNRYDKITKQYEHYFHRPDDPNSLSMDFIKSVYVDRTGAVWIGTLFGGLNKYDRGNNSFKTIEQTCSNFEFGYDICAMLEDSYQIFWLGNSLGLYKYNRAKNQFSKYISDTSIGSIYEDSKSNLWIGTLSGGLYRYDREMDFFKSIVVERGKRTGLAGNSIYCIAEVKNQSDELWIGTSVGLKSINIDSGLVKDYSIINNQLNDKEIYGIFYDSDENLWLSTTKGILNYNPATNHMVLFDEYDGARGIVYTAYSPFQDSDGKLYFGSFNGYTVFDPDSIRLNTIPPQLVLTELKINNKPFKAALESPHISLLPELHLKHDQNDIEIEFAALHYSSPAQNQYAYILEGYDADWIHQDASDRNAKYTNLDPGEYVFRVKGSNNDGVWNEEGCSLTIIITPPWWETTWAYLGYVLLIGGVLFGAWRFQLSRIKLRHQVELELAKTERYQEIDRMKSRFFANISHEFRTPLTLILGPIEKLQKRLKDDQALKDLRLMKKHTQRILNLVSQLLDLSKLEARRMELRTSKQNIIPLLKGLTQSFISLADKKQVELIFESKTDQLEVYFQRDIIVKILNNLLSNACKFTRRGGQITVAVNEKQNNGKTGVVEISVTDTGVGIPRTELPKIFDRFHQVDSSQTREYEGTGIGLSLTKELVELHSGTITVQSTLGTGSTFTVQLPLGKDHLLPEEIVGAAGESDELPMDTAEPIEPEADADKRTINWESTWEILIVEDNADVRQYIRSYLEEDYRITEARNGEEGLKKALSKIPDLVISDIMMPEMDGLELCRRLKNDERTSHIPVILLTAKAEVEDRLSGLKTGADDYLSKPFEARELLVRIRNLIDQRHRLQERFRKDFSILPDNLELTSVDRQFITRTVEIIQQNLDNSDLNVGELARQLGMSRQYLNRKINAITGLSSQIFIRSIRLRNAAQMLKNQQASVTEIAYLVGFASPSHFSESFRQEFGYTPSQYISNNLE